MCGHAGGEGVLGAGMITTLKNTILLEPVNPCAEDPICTDRIERKLFLGREADGMTVEATIEEVLELPQIYTPFVPKRTYRNN